MICENCKKKITLKKQRSDKQNRYMHGVPYQYLCEYFKEFGYTKEDVHEICKHKFLKKFVLIDGEYFEITRSTRSLSTSEMEAFLENIRMWAAELGCNIPEPNERIEECSAHSKPQI